MQLPFFSLFAAVMPKRKADENRAHGRRWKDLKFKQQTFREEYPSIVKSSLWIHQKTAMLCILCGGMFCSLTRICALHLKSKYYTWNQISFHLSLLKSWQLWIKVATTEREREKIETFKVMYKLVFTILSIVILIADSFFLGLLFSRFTTFRNALHTNSWP